MWTALKLILYYFGYQLGFSAANSVISAFISPIDTTTSISVAMVASTLAMTWHLIRFKYVDLTNDKYKKLNLNTVLVSVVFVYTATTTLNLLIEQAGIPDTMAHTFISMSHTPLGMLTIALLAPLSEEFLFRGAIERHLLHSWKSPWAAIIVSSFIFGIVHMNPAQIPFAFLMGTMFGWLYWRTGSLLPGIIGHVLNNYLAAIHMRRYGETPLEEHIHSTLAVWILIATLATACLFIAKWLHNHLDRDNASTNDNCGKKVSDDYQRSEKQE